MNVQMHASHIELIIKCFLQVFKGWLIGIANYLKTIEVKTPSLNGRRMCSVLVILNLLWKLLGHLHASDSDASEISWLFSMLYLKPHIHQPCPKCLDLEFLLDCVPQSHHKALANILTHFVKFVLQRDDLKKPEWVYVIPLIHFFSKKVKPFDAPAIATARIEWVHSGITHAVKRATSVKAARYVCIMC